MQNVIIEEAFIPGNLEDSVYRTGDSKVDLKNFMVKILRKEKVYRVYTEYLAKEVADESSKSLMK